MPDLYNAFISKTFLRSIWTLEYEAFRGSEEEAALEQRLLRWASRKDLRETSAEAAFIQEFFHDTWGYEQTGQAGAETGTFSLWPKFPVAGAGEKGGVGSADLAIGVFRRDEKTPVPQVLCEFKDIKSELDAPQKRKGNNRSPVRQCLDYLGNARRGMFPSDPILPTWGIVTDMNEFRLYWFDKGHHQSLRFNIRSEDLFKGTSLISGGETARFDRFLFRKVFHRDSLISDVGRSALLGLIGQQKFRDRQLENTFYAEYRAFRERLYKVLLKHNGEGTPRFPGTRGRLVRLAQRILDRCIFIFFCEDMGQVLAFPPKLLQEFLIERSKDKYFDPDASTIWQDLLRLFNAMNDGRAFGGKALNQFNGGLFVHDHDLEQLEVPNSVFCQHLQGANEASLYAHKETLLYLCASYNYASDLNRSDEHRKSEREKTNSLGLYTLGRIFEQSITELEILEAEADNRRSLNKESKRKRDGVYYTPEWVVERIVDETLGPILDKIKEECGWFPAGDPSLESIEKYSARLKSLTVLDPACGSGAFLITVLRYLLDSWHEVQGLRRQITKGRAEKNTDDELIADILRTNIYGVDINPASVEIARLALWLHTARGDKPLSSLNEHIKEGNSLIGNDFYLGQSDAFYDDTQKERVNAFEWKDSFKSIFERGGFDAVVGNPPYVKLQNFRAVHADMADFLRNGRPEYDYKPYASTQTGNFDLYLPFIERGLSLLNDDGRLGFIAPSVWTTNEYGDGLRSLIAKGRHLAGWIDFKAYQIFDESTTYTALQFFTKAPSPCINIFNAPDGEIPEDAWAQSGSLAYGKQEFGERWLLLTGDERALIDKIYSTCDRLDDASHTKQIFQGLITSADAIYHLTRLGRGRYLCTPRGNDAPPPYEVELEDAIMKPLVSGAEAKRYVEPVTTTYLLFPYENRGGNIELIDEGKLRENYPKTWAYLKSYEETLRLREASRDEDGNVTEAPFDDEAWYRFGRRQNLDKQEIVKLVVPRLVLNLGCSVDEHGSVYLDNVDVGGIVAADDEDAFFLAGILNSSVANFVFRRISKPFRGSYLSANKQFIAPLPIPRVNRERRSAASLIARHLQAAHTSRRNILERIAHRLSAARVRSKPESWIFVGLKAKRELLAEAPDRLDPDKKLQWAEQRYNVELTTRLEGISARLLPGVGWRPYFHDGELSIEIDGVRVIDRIFVSHDEGEFIVAQWKLLSSMFSITEKTDGRKFINALRKLVVPENQALVEQVKVLEAELSAIEANIEASEAEMNAFVNKLYALTDAEVRLVSNN